MTRRLLTLLCVFGAISLVTPSDAQKRRKTVQIGVVLDGEVEGTRTMLDAMKVQISEIAGSSYQVQFPPELTLPGSFDAAKIASSLDTLLANPKVDVIWTFGVLSSMEATRRTSLARPVIAPFILDRKAQGLPYKSGRSGLKNLNYIEMPWSLERDLAVFKEVTGTTRATLVIGKYIADASPIFKEGTVRAGKAVGMELVVLGAEGTAAEILAQIPKDVTSVYLAPLAQTTAEEKQRLIDALNERRVAIYASQGESVVREGALVGRRPNTAITRVARRMALHTVRILGGDEAGNLPVALNLPERLVINMQTARKIGVSPSFLVLTEAEVINPIRKNAGRELSLALVTKQALEGNVSIKALTQVVAAGRASIKSARSALLPQINASTTARVIDKDRAATSFGSAPQFLWNGEIGVNQVLYSEDANAALSAQKSFQVSREQQLVQTRWDIAAEVGIAYLNVLRLKTAEKINRSNLKVTRANLELARMRFDAGSSSKADVYRWESKIALDRKSVIEASAQRNVAEVDLQRILNRPPEEPFVTAEVDLLSDKILKPVGGVYPFIGDPLSFRLFRQFMVGEAVDRAPEIKQFDAAIAAQERFLVASKRRLYAPTVAASAGLTQRFDRRGEGTASAAPSPPNSTEWFAGVTLSIPILEGGGATAEIQRQSAEVLRLQRERDDLRNRIAQRATSSMHLMGASHAGIKLSRESAEAARQNFELIAASYGEGAARVVDLLDAQNAWVTADQLAADSIYGFIIDVLNSLRAVGRFELASDPVKLAAFLARAEKYVTKARGAASGAE